MKRFYLILIILSLFSCKDDPTVQPEIVNNGYEFWPGKSGVIKTDIEFPGNFVSEYNLSLYNGSRGDSFIYRLPLDENDADKKGKIEVNVFSDVEKAQLALVDYLDGMVSPNKPPRLTNEAYKVGDVAFGKVYDGILKIEFARNNVLVIVHAPTNTCKSIVSALDEAIQKAPEWQAGTPTPSFILPN